MQKRVIEQSAEHSVSPLYHGALTTSYWLAHMMRAIHSTSSHRQRALVVLRD